MIDLELVGLKSFVQSLSIFPDESWISVDLVPLSVGGVVRNIFCPEHVPKIHSFFQAVSYVLKYLNSDSE